MEWPYTADGQPVLASAVHARVLQALIRHRRRGLTIAEISAMIRAGHGVVLNAASLQRWLETDESNGYTARDEQGRWLPTPQLKEIINEA